MKKVDFRC